MKVLEDGIAAAKAGHKKKARTLLRKALKQDPRNEKAWLWLATIMPTKEDAVICLENVLKINPSNQQAKAGLRKLTARPEVRPKKSVAEEVEPAKSVEVEEEPGAATASLPYTRERLETEMPDWLELADYFYKKGQKRRQMEDSLAKKGLDRRFATIVVKEFFKRRRPGGLQKMGSGCVGCLGIFILVNFIALVTTQTGWGDAIIIAIACGAMLFSLIWFLVGLTQFLGG